MRNLVRQFLAPATRKAGGWSRQQRPTRPPRPAAIIASPPMAASVPCGRHGLALGLFARWLSPPTSRLAMLAAPPAPPALRATRSAPRAARSAAIAAGLAAAYCVRLRLLAGARRRRLLDGLPC